MSEAKIEGQEMGKEGLHVVWVYADSPREWNCSQWRCLTPSNAMNAAADRGWKAKLIHVSGFMDFLSPFIQDLVAPCDIIVFQRNLATAPALNALEYWQGHGKPVLVDLDDAYQMLPWSNPAHRYWIEKDGREAIRRLEEGLSKTDGLVAPNRLLLKDWSHVTRGSFYLQNYAEGAWWVDLPSREELKKERGLEDRVIIGWGGSVSHYDSWWGSGLQEAARRVSKRHPEVLWLICGNDPRIVAQLPVPNDQKMAQRGVPPEVWPRTVKVFDIGVAPLFGPYDQRRSWIKGLEYLLAGVPWVGTGGEPYRELQEMGLGKYVSFGPDEWEERIEDLLSKLPEEQELAGVRIKMAQQWFIANQLPTFHQAYNRAIRNFIDDHGRLTGVYKIEPEKDQEGADNDNG